MPNIILNDTTKGWKVTASFCNIAEYDYESKIFSKRDKPSKRYQCLKDGEGHGFPYEVYTRLKEVGCEFIRFVEPKTTWEIPFDLFKLKMEFRNHGELKVYVSLKWCHKLGEEPQVEFTQESVMELTPPPSQLPLFLAVDNTLEEVA